MSHNTAYDSNSVNINKQLTARKLPFTQDAKSPPTRTRFVFETVYFNFYLQIAQYKIDRTILHVMGLTINIDIRIAYSLQY